MDAERGRARGRLVFLSGACGAGKTAVLSLGLSRMRAAFGGDVAAIDTDRLLMFFDPRWELKYPEAEPYWELAGRQWILLARSYFEFGFAAVIIGGNGVWQREGVPKSRRPSPTSPTRITSASTRLWM